MTLNDNVRHSLSFIHLKFNYRLGCLSGMFAVHGDDDLMASRLTAADVASPTRMRVLVVEDEPLIAFDLIAEIESGQHDVVGQCSTAETAIRLAETLKPDVVVMDIGLMGRRNGLQAAQEIRSRFGIGSIFVSATLDRVDPETWGQIQPLALIRKPYRDEDLNQAIARGGRG